MTEWIEVGKTFGVTFLVLIGVAFFWVKYVWPFITQQVKDSKEAIISASAELGMQRQEFLVSLHEERETNVGAMEKRDKMLAEALDHRDRILSEALGKHDDALQEQSKMFSESLTRRDASLSRIAETLDQLGSLIERQGRTH